MKSIILLSTSLLVSIMASSLNPQRGYDFTPEDFGMEYQEVHIKTEDDVNLTGWWLKPMDEKSKKCIVFSHSGEGNMQEYLEYVSNFVSLGYYVLMYDYRGYGTSDEFHISNRFYFYSQFARDITGALDWVHKYKASFSVDMYGVGIGAGLSLAVAANRPEVEYVIADGPYTTLTKVQDNWMKANNEKIMIPLGFDKNYIEPEFGLASGGAQLKGILLIASTSDQIIPLSDIQNLQKIHKKGCKIFTVASEDNSQNLSTNKDAYFQQVKDFLGIK